MLIVVPTVKASDYAESAVTQDLNITHPKTFTCTKHSEIKCPFKEEQDCKILATKPIIKETIVPYNPNIKSELVNKFISAASLNYEISANDVVSAPLLQRYKILMRASKSCCTEGLIYKLHKQNASDTKIYTALINDANNYYVGNRCLVTPDDMFNPDADISVKTAIDIRNACLCKNRDWFVGLLEPFKHIYSIIPEFQNYNFYYTYIDDLQRQITVSVNADVQTTLAQLSNCP